MSGGITPIADPRTSRDGITPIADPRRAAPGVPAGVSSYLNRAIPAFGAGMFSPIAGGVQLLGKAISEIPGVGPQAWASRLAAADLALQNKAPGTALAGTILSPLNLLGPETVGGSRILAGALGGAAAGAAQPVEAGRKFWQDKIKQAAAGGTLGAGAGALGGKLAKTAASPAAAYARKGVPITPGQALGGLVREAEGVLASSPATVLIQPALERAEAGWNKTVFAGIAKQFGVPYAGKIGHDGIEALQKASKQAYSRVLDNWTIRIPGLKAVYSGTHPDMAVVDALGLRTQFEDLAPQSQESVLREIRKLVTRPWGAGPRPTAITGQMYKTADSAIGKTMLDYMGPGNNAYEKQVGAFLGLVQKGLRSFVARLDPAKAADLGKVDQGYAMLQVVQQAASDATRNEGVFSYDQLLAASKKVAGAAKRFAVARGAATLQQEARQAKQALAPIVPELNWLRTESLLALPFLAAAHPVRAAKAATAMIPWLPGVRQGITAAATSPESAVRAVHAGGLAGALAGLNLGQ